MVDHNNGYYYFYFQLCAHSLDAHQPAASSLNRFMMIIIISFGPGTNVPWQILEIAVSFSIFFCVCKVCTVEEASETMNGIESKKERERET